jgi:hypothetical protein
MQFFKNIIRELKVKIKVLAIAITGILLSGCGNDDNGSYPTTPTPTLKVQAYDPAILGMNATADCEDGTTETRTTDYYGNASFTSATILSTPETCKFTFVGDENSFDATNSKPMNGVTYIIPEGLANKDAAAITATPISTLIAKKLNGVAYTPAAATTVMEELGLDAILGAQGIDFTEFLLNTSNVMDNLKADPSAAIEFSKLSATTTVLTDVLKTNSNATLTAIEVTAMAKASKALTVDVLTANPGYPAGGVEKGAPVYVSYNETTLKTYIEATVTAVTTDPDAEAPAAIAPDTTPAEVKPEPKPDDKPTDSGSGSGSGSGSTTNGGVNGTGS